MNECKRQINPRPSESKNLAEYFGEVRKVYEQILSENFLLTNLNTVNTTVEFEV